MTIKFDTGTINGDELNFLVEHGVADLDDFTEVNNSNLFEFHGDPTDIFVTSFNDLKTISSRFNVSILTEGVLIKK